MFNKTKFFSKLKTGVACLVLVQVCLSYYRVSDENKAARILLWTENQGKVLIDNLPEELVVDSSSNFKSIFCPKTQVTCQLTLDKEFVLEADAVWFHIRDVM